MNRILRAVLVAGIALQDFSLENCLLSYDLDGVYALKLCDPGQAVIFERDENGRELPVPYRGCIGKKFRPPEIFTQKEYLGTKVDSWCLGWSTFYLLCASELFGSCHPHDDDIRWKYYSVGDMESILKLSGLRDNHLSAMSVDFIRKLVNIDPSTRLSCEDALNHDFLKGVCGMPFTTHDIPRRMDDQKTPSQLALQLLSLCEPQHRPKLLKSLSIQFPAIAAALPYAPSTPVELLQAKSNNVRRLTADKHPYVPLIYSTELIEKFCTPTRPSYCLIRHRAKTLKTTLSPTALGSTFGRKPRCHSPGVGLTGRGLNSLSDLPPPLPTDKTPCLAPSDRVSKLITDPAGIESGPRPKKPQTLHTSPVGFPVNQILSSMKAASMCREETETRGSNRRGTARSDRNSAKSQLGSKHEQLLGGKDRRAGDKHDRGSSCTSDSLTSDSTSEGKTESFSKCSDTCKLKPSLIHQTSLTDTATSTPSMHQLAEQPGTPASLDSMSTRSLKMEILSQRKFFEAHTKGDTYEKTNSLSKKLCEEAVRKESTATFPPIRMVDIPIKMIPSMSAFKALKEPLPEYSVAPVVDKKKAIHTPPLGVRSNTPNCQPSTCSSPPEVKAHIYQNALMSEPFEPRVDPMWPPVSAVTAPPTSPRGILNPAAVNFTNAPSPPRRRGTGSSERQITARQPSKLRSDNTHILSSVLETEMYEQGTLRSSSTLPLSCSNNTNSTATIDGDLVSTRKKLKRPESARLRLDPGNQTARSQEKPQRAYAATERAHGLPYNSHFLQQQFRKATSATTDLLEQKGICKPRSLAALAASWSISRQVETSALASAVTNRSQQVLQPRSAGYTDSSTFRLQANGRWVRSSGGPFLSGST